MMEKHKPPLCLHCHTPARLVTADKIYRMNPKFDDRLFWLCKCGAYVGCHKGTNKPLGFPANTDTRRARSLLHEHRLDPMWKNKPPSERMDARSALYRYLQERMNLPIGMTHIGMFTIEQCQTAWVLLAQYKAERK